VICLQIAFFRHRVPHGMGVALYRVAPCFTWVVWSGRHVATDGGCVFGVGVGVGACQAAVGGIPRSQLSERHEANALVLPIVTCREYRLEDAEYSSLSGRQGSASGAKHGHSQSGRAVGVDARDSTAGIRHAHLHYRDEAALRWAHGGRAGLQLCHELYPHGAGPGVWEVSPPCTVGCGPCALFMMLKLARLIA
jgi:hypothetical protein